MTAEVNHATFVKPYAPCVPGKSVYGGRGSGEGVRVAVMDSVAEGVAVGEIVVDGVCEEVAVPDDVPLPVGDIEAVALALTVDDDVIVGVMVALNETEGVLLAEPLTDKVLVGVELTVLERLIVVELLSLPLGVCVGVCEEVLVTEGVTVGDTGDGELVGESPAGAGGAGDGLTSCVMVSTGSSVKFADTELFTDSMAEDGATTSTTRDVTVTSSRRARAAEALRRRAPQEPVLRGSEGRMGTCTFDASP